MSLISLIWANLFRKRTRTALTIASIMIAFLLFVLLRSISAAFEGGVRVEGVDRLVIGGKYSQIDLLPYSQKQQILGIEGVQAITHSNWFGGVYQDPKNFFAKYPVDPLSYFDIYSELDLHPADALQQFAARRTSAVADIGLAEKYGWQLGDVIPVMGDIYAKANGERLWEFELVGTFSENGGSSNFPLFLFHFDYFNESVTEFNQNMVGNWTVRVSDVQAADTIAQQIDALFENSSDPTRTISEDESNRQFARQLGDIGFITTIIMSAVFFTIILLTGNTMTQALRERIPELAVIKTLGFTDNTVTVLVLGEAVLLCLIGGGIGVGIAFLLGPGMSQALEGVFGTFEVTPAICAFAMALSVAIGLIIGLMPALTARRLTIVEALRRA